MSDTQQFPLDRGNPIFYGLPEALKDPKCVPKIERALLETLACPTSHSDPLAMAECKRCTENMLKRRALMQRLGFRSAAQYMAWRKVHAEIKKRIPLVNWKDK